jgi:hypothetical protein
MARKFRRVQRHRCPHALLAFFRRAHQDGDRFILQCQICGSTFGENARLERWPADRSTIPPLVRWEPAGRHRQLLLDFPQNG